MPEAKEELPFRPIEVDALLTGFHVKPYYLKAFSRHMFAFANICPFHFRRHLWFEDVVRKCGRRKRMVVEDGLKRECEKRSELSVSHESVKSIGR